MRIELANHAPQITGQLIGVVGANCVGKAGMAQTSALILVPAKAYSFPQETLRLLARDPQAGILLWAPFPCPWLDPVGPVPDLVLADRSDHGVPLRRGFSQGLRMEQVGHKGVEGLQPPMKLTSSGRMPTVWAASTISPGG